MKDDTISRQAAIDAVMDEFKRFPTSAIRAKTRIEALPSAQPEIVRCKDCKHKGTKNCVANAWTTIFGVMVKDDFYCGLAERRTDEQTV